MGLKIKPAPTQLDPEIVETIWPGDDQVDIERADLLAWCLDGGRSGLPVKGEGAQVINVRALRPRALARVMSIVGDPNMADEAFRFGVVSAPGVNIGWDRFGGVRGLNDATMEVFEQLHFEIPFLATIDLINGVEREKVRTDLVDVPLTAALGAQILLMTFRKR